MRPDNRAGPLLCGSGEQFGVKSRSKDDRMAALAAEFRQNDGAARSVKLAHQLADQVGADQRVIHEEENNPIGLHFPKTAERLLDRRELALLPLWIQHNPPALE